MIDRVCTQAVLHAEKKCRKIHAGGKPYTPELNRLGRQIDAWRMIVKKKLGCNISTRKIKRAALAHDIPRISTKGKGITPGDMRTIWLMEVDVNAGAKIHFVKRMMNETAIPNGLILVSQYAKKYNKAMEAAIVKVLFFDYLRQTRNQG